MDELSFTTRREDGTYDAWNPSPTGNYTEDCSTGNKYFDEVQALLDKAPNPLLLTWIIQAMIQKGQITGVETGFLHALSARV